MLSFYDVLCALTGLVYFMLFVELVSSRPKRKSKRRRVWIEEED